MKIREAIRVCLAMARTTERRNRLENDDEAMEMVRVFLAADNTELHNVIRPALINVLHCAEGTLTGKPVEVDIDNCRKVSQYIEHGVIPDGEKTQVFNVANLKEQMQENVLAVLDGLLDHIGPAVKNAVEGQVCQVILDTIDPPENRSHTDPAGIEFYVQRTDLHEWSVFQKYTDIHGSTWETSPCDTVDDCDTEAEAVQAYKELIQGRIDAES